MVAASFAWPEIPPPSFSPSCDPPRLSEILPALMQRYGLVTQVMEGCEYSHAATSGNGASSRQQELTRSCTRDNSSPRGERIAASLCTRCRDSQ